MRSMPASAAKTCARSAEHGSERGSEPQELAREIGGEIRVVEEHDVRLMASLPGRAQVSQYQRRVVGPFSPYRS
jgi:hypothetical protein